MGEIEENLSPFEPIKNFIADFVCHAAKLVIELDGGQHNWQQEADAHKLVPKRLEMLRIS